jgi:hypothetical protein
MVSLVAILSTGKGTWQEVAQLINKSEFDEVFILTNGFGKDKFTNLPDKKIEVFAFNFEKEIIALTNDFYSALKGYIKFGDIALNISSGSGKEHMALFSAMMKLGAGIRLVSIKDNNIIEISPHLDPETGKVI